MAINTGRVIGGGLLAGAVMNFIDFLVNGVWLAQQWMDEATALNPRLAAPEAATPSMIGWIVTDFLLGIFIVWSYAAMRPRFGPGAGTAVKAALLVWAVSHLAYASFAFLGMYSLNLIVVVSIGGLVAALAGGYAGCSVYKEDA
ncbi:MAG TPA: hypothetical protein VMN81_03775 [Vicinamibacterales bacterium]|nr:hypothetical protein [Vicinamibacterales bacterium]